jgi:hypothetical protein
MYWHAPCDGLFPLTSRELKMKIEESVVILGGRHHLESECATEISTKCSFRSILNGVSEASASTEVPEAAPNFPAAKNDKLLLMLEQLIAELLELISGLYTVKLTDVNNVVKSEGADPSGNLKEGLPRNTPREFVWETTTTEKIVEHEQSEFSASGEVHTADGRAIDFKLDLAMCRDFQCERKQIEQGKVVMRDPLVINFDGKAVELGNLRFDFDLDSDGKNESLQGLRGNSGFLAMDLNGDGHINDGNELFGARSGDGFADLARLDSDGNHWLDEADAAFAGLKVWSPAGDGKESLVSLKERGVGALYLGATDTPFLLKDDDNRLQGQVRASGLYLRENGAAGTLQQIDLAV